ncbi:MAG: threonine/serine exporter family protein [Bullifex sp.]
MKPEVIIASFFGTVAFAILYDIPSKYCFVSGLNGMAGWIVCSILTPLAGEMGAIFAATLAIALISRYLAVVMKCPEIAFLVSGIFPIVPGAGIYWTAYYLMSGQMTQAATTGTGALKTCLAMVLGIAVIHELPQWIFSGRRKK